MSKSIFKLSGVLAVVVFTSALSLGSANAALYTSTGACLVGDVSAAADQCFGAIVQNVNDSEALLNTNQFGVAASPVGLFGHTDWDFLAKADTPGGLSGTNIGLSVTPTGGALSGSWSVNAGALSTFARVVLILKASNTFSAYLYEPGSNALSSGTWSTAAIRNNGGQQPNLSHLSIYTSGVSAVPVPASVWLFGTALIGFIGFSRRTKV